MIEHLISTNISEIILLGPYGNGCGHSFEIWRTACAHTLPTITIFVTHLCFACLQNCCQFCCPIRSTECCVCLSFLFCFDNHVSFLFSLSLSLSLSLSPLQWPFVRFLGIQEPASVLFSVLNGAASLAGYFMFVRSASPSYPYRGVLRTQILVREV